jgi:hypothetical protein
VKNPFVQMALLAAAMSAAFRENIARDAGIVMPTSRGSRGTPGPRNPAGSKLIRKFYRNKHGAKANYKTARDWYREARR